MDDLLRDLSVGPGIDVQVVGGPEIQEQLGLVVSPSPVQLVRRKSAPATVGKRGRGNSKRIRRQRKKSRRRYKAKRQKSRKRKTKQRKSRRR